MSKEITTAVIAAAGMATRMWPASKSIPKELFPLGRVPAIVHLWWELADVGVSKIILVVGKGSGEIFKALCDPATLPPSKIADDPVVQRFQKLLQETEFLYVQQLGNYGNATPLIQAGKELGSSLTQKPCIYAFGDDIVFGENVSAGIVNTYRQTHCPVLAAQKVEPERKSQFGILECYEHLGNEYVSRLLEKPAIDQTKSNLASFGRYLVTPELFEILSEIRPGRDGEIWFVDSVIQLLKNRGRVSAFTLQKGRWYTVGDPKSYAAATLAAQLEQ